MGRHRFVRLDEFTAGCGNRAWLDEGARPVWKAYVSPHLSDSEYHGRCDVAADAGPGPYRCPFAPGYLDAVVPRKMYGWWKHVRAPRLPTRNSAQIWRGRSNGSLTTRGDGAGFDIASFNADATPRLIEVKTTGLGKYFPFIVTSNEVRVSEREASAYSLYRVFDFATQPRLYLLPGALTVSCHLEPTQYRARVGQLRRD